MAAVARVCARLAAIVQRLTTRQVTTNQCQTQTQRCLHLAGVQCAPGIVQAGEDPLKLSNKDWERRMSPEQYYVCREKGTELPFTGEHVHNHEKGIYCCSCCGVQLFSSETKYDSGSGWPSFYEPLNADGKDESSTNILRCRDNSRGMSRTEVVCKQCDAHLGHVFPDGPQPTGNRFCMNSVSLHFEPDSKPE